MRFQSSGTCFLGVELDKEGDDEKASDDDNGVTGSVEGTALDELGPEEPIPLSASFFFCRVRIIRVAALLVLEPTCLATIVGSQGSQ